MRSRSAHPTQRELALLVGGDLGRFARWRVTRHAARCQVCRRAVASYEQDRRELGALAPLPAVDFAALGHRIRVAAAQAGPRRALPGRRRWGIAGAALAAAAALGALFLQVPDTRREISPATPRTGLLQPADFGGLPVGADAQVTADGHLSFRAFHSGSGQLTITEYYVP